VARLFSFSIHTSMCIASMSQFLRELHPPTLTLRFTNSTKL
jgi:hypothetical protein